MRNTVQRVPVAFFFFVSRVLRIHIYASFFFLILTRHDSVVGNRDRGKMGYVITTAILR